MHFPLRSSYQYGNGCIPDVSSEKTNSMLCFCVILWRHRNDSLIYKFLISSVRVNFIGKSGAFQGLLYCYKRLVLGFRTITVLLRLILADHKESKSAECLHTIHSVNFKFDTRQSLPCILIGFEFLSIKCYSRDELE